MGKWRRKKKKRGSGFSGRQKVGGTTQQCADLTSGLVVIVRHIVTRKPVARAIVKIVGPTAGAAGTSLKGLAAFFPIQHGNYKIHVTLAPDMVPRFEPVPVNATTVPKGFCWNKTIYIVPLAGLRVKVLARKRARVQIGQQRAAREPLHGVVVRVNELGRTQATGIPTGWADFGVVKPGRYTATVEFWGPHGDRYKLVGGVGKQGTVVRGRVTDIILEAVPSGWIEFQVVYDKPEKGEKAEIPDVNLRVKIPGGTTQRHKTNASGLVRIDELDPGTCDIEEGSRDKPTLELVSG